MQTISLFSGLALKDVLEDSLLPPFLTQTECTIDRTYEPTKVLYDLIRDGARPDVIIGVTSALHDMAKDGYVQPESIRGLVRSDVGIAVLAGAPHPSLKTKEDFVTMLRRAKSVAYSEAGASGGVFQRVMTDLDLARLVADKAVILAKGFTAEAVLDGRAEIAIQQISELASVPGIEIVGALPASLNAFVELSIAVGADPKDSSVAQALVRHLCDIDNTPIYDQGFMRLIS